MRANYSGKMRKEHRLAPKDNNDSVQQIFTEYLLSKGHRKTPERYTILHEIYATEGHFDVESLYMKMKRNKYRVSRATLYNTIELLIECNLVSRHQFGNGSALYEKAYKFQQHDHVIIEQDGEVINILEFCDPRIQEIKQDVERLLGVKISGHSLTFYSNLPVVRPSASKEDQ